MRPDVREPGAVVGTGQQRPPGDAIWWVLQGGRGSGKSFPAVHYFCRDAEELGPAFVGVILASTDEEARKFIEDERSGLLAMLPPWRRPTWQVSVAGGRLTWRSGAVAHVYSAERPNAGRAANFNRWLIDDLPKFGPRGLDVFKALARAFRLSGAGLRAYLTTTPPGDPAPGCPELLEHVLAPQLDPARARAERWVYSISPSDANMANLDADTRTVLSQFAGTAADEAERGGVYDPLGGLKLFSGIEFSREPVRTLEVPAELDVLTISIDPADSGASKACEVGIVAAGLVAGRALAFLLEDASANLDSDAWPVRAWDLAERWAPRAKRWRFVIEVNRGTKDSSLLRAQEVIRKLARGEAGFSTCEIRTVTSRDDKGARAAPLPTVYRAGQIRHLPGLAIVEGQMHRLAAVGKSSGRLDRADAAVYALLDLLGLLDGQTVTTLGTVASAGVGTFGAPAHGSIAVASGPASSSALTMLPPGHGSPSAGVSAFGRSSSGW